MTPQNKRQRSRAGQHTRAFTLVELLVVIAIVGILAGLLLPALSNAKAKAKRTACQGNLRQLQLAVQLYADDFENELPPRSYQGGAVWVDLAQPYFGDRKLLRCPVDRAEIDQSYLLNGFIDFFLVNSFKGNWDAFFGAYKSGGFPGMQLSQITKPSETITVGERRADSKETDDAYMDMWPPEFGSDHLVEVAHAKHRAGRSEASGGSNYAFADGGVRFLKYGAAFSPVNLWAVTEQFRNAPLPEL